MAKVSIVIRAKNEEKFIGRTLESVFSQKFRDFEVIVVDSGSTDRTLDIVAKYPVKIIQIPPEDFTYGYALNMGYKASKGKYLVSLSAHAVPINNMWLSNLLRHFKDEKVAGVSGLPYNDRQPRLGIEIITKENYPQKIHHGLTNSNGAIRRDLWERFPFDEGLPGAEDKEWAWRVMQLGYKIVVDGEACVWHEHKESLLEIYDRAWRGAYVHSKFLEGYNYGLTKLLRELYRSYKTLPKDIDKEMWFQVLLSPVVRVVGKYFGWRRKSLINCPSYLKMRSRA